ncbi:hypothetical protein [Micromonospora sp. NPDC049359]|uniref:hypothetical protein n=1 Tax=Micromonospora sp. NPDC049359 TaxID=3364270 RepID=UPI00378A398B
MTNGGDREFESLDIVRAELDVERTAQEKRAETVDSRAGQVLGFAGVLAGLALNSKSGWALPGAVVAAAAATLVASILRPRMQAGIYPRGLYLGYINKKPDCTKRVVLDTRIADYESNKDQLDIKLNRLDWAVRLLVLAITLVVLALLAVILR